MSSPLRLDPAAEAELDRLDKAGHEVLLERLEDALDELAADPGGRSSRRRAFRGGTFGITVRDPDRDWLIVWEPAEAVTAVLYIGPDPFA